MGHGFSFSFQWLLARAFCARQGVPIKVDYSFVYKQNDSRQLNARNPALERQNSVCADVRRKLLSKIPRRS
jgi:hypothetical protein